MLAKIYEHYIHHIEEMPKIYIDIAEADGNERAVCDYIAGMTDSYAIKTYKELFIPQSWH